MPSYKWLNILIEAQINSLFWSVSWSPSYCERSECVSSKARSPQPRCPQLRRPHNDAAAHTETPDGGISNASNIVQDHYRRCPRAPEDEGEARGTTAVGIPHHRHPTAGCHGDPRAAWPNSAASGMHHGAPAWLSSASHFGRPTGFLRRKWRFPDTILCSYREDHTSPMLTGD